MTGGDINPPMKYSGFCIILGSRVIRDYDEIACRVQIWDVKCRINFYTHIRRIIIMIFYAGSDCV